MRELIRRRCRVGLAVRSTGTCLARWGFTAPKPVRRACEQDPAAVRRWLRRDYPGIVKRAKQARGVVAWGDETGLRSDDVRGRSCAPRGRTPAVRVCQKRAKPSLISAVTNRGELRWMVVDGAVNAPAFIRFLRRLVRDARRKVFLVLDRPKAHRARLTRDWLAPSTGRRPRPATCPRTARSSIRTRARTPTSSGRSPARRRRAADSG